MNNKTNAELESEYGLRKKTVKIATAKKHESSAAHLWKIGLIARAIEKDFNQSVEGLDFLESKNDGDELTK
jgi:hypothetical protein